MYRERSTISRWQSDGKSRKGEKREMRRTVYIYYAKGRKTTVLKWPKQCRRARRFGMQKSMENPSTVQNRHNQYLGEMERSRRR